MHRGVVVYHYFALTLTEMMGSYTGTARLPVVG